MGNSYENGMANLWSPTDCTAEEVLAELGTDAAQIFALSAAMREFVNTIRPGTIPPPDLPPFIVHADGRVELNDSSSQLDNPA